MDASDLLTRMGIVLPPVPVDEIAQGLGVRVVPLPGSDRVSGAIVRRNGQILIAVNPSHHINRQRFTIAHELGHLCLGHLPEIGEEHVDEDFRVRFRDSNSGLAVDRYEIDANAFAADLLMPATFIDSAVNSLGVLDESLIQFLARRFKVSTQAMEFRLRNLSYLPPSF